MGHFAVGTTTDTTYGLKVVSNTEDLFFQGYGGASGYTKIKLNNGTGQYIFKIATYSSSSELMMGQPVAEIGTYTDDVRGDGEVYIFTRNIDGTVSTMLDLRSELGTIEFNATNGMLFSNTSTTTFASYIDVLGDASATSTFTGNLHVQGTLRAAVSYVGDLVFANSFRFYEDPMPVEGETATGTQHLKLTNQRNEDIFSIDEEGNLTIKGKLTQATTTEESVISLGFTWILDQFKTIGVTIADGVMNLKKLIVSDEVCIGETCINEAKLKEIIEKNITPSTPAVEPSPIVETPVEPAPVIETPPAETSTTTTEIIPETVVVTEVVPEVTPEPIIIEPVVEPIPSV